jgi:hypothetical protein
MRYKSSSSGFTAYTPSSPAGRKPVQNKAACFTIYGGIINSNPFAVRADIA